MKLANNAPEDDERRFARRFGRSYRLRRLGPGERLPGATHLVARRLASGRIIAFPLRLADEPLNVESPATLLWHDAAQRMAAARGLTPVELLDRMERLAA